jgi:hypothetical protein
MVELLMAAVHVMMPKWYGLQGLIIIIIIIIIIMSQLPCVYAAAIACVCAVWKCRSAAAESVCTIWAGQRAGLCACSSLCLGLAA